MRTRLPVLLLTILVALLFVNLGTALTRNHDDAPGAPAAPLPPAAPAAAPAPIDGEGERMIEQRFDVSAGDDLCVGVAHADVVVETGAGDEARVEVFLKARDMERAREYFEDLRFEVRKEGNTVSVTTNQRPGRRNWSFDRSGGARILVRIAIPETFDADLSVAHGDLHLAALDGRAEIAMAHGDVTTGALRGPALSVELAHGDLRAERWEAETVTLRSTHGNVSVAEMLAGRFDAEAAHGDVVIGAFEGHAEAEAAHGDIEIRFTKSNGFRLRNTHGDIAVQLPPDIPGDVRLGGSDVRIASEFAFEGTVREHSAEGSLNGGGPTMDAQASHGSVTLRAD